MEHFGTTTKGEDVHRLTISAGDLSVKILTLGAAVQDVRLAGVDRNLTLGSETLSDYENGMGYFGTIVGPIANRISHGRLRIKGMMYELERNEKGRTHLHSGSEGVHARVWRVTDHTQDSVTLTLDLPDGAAGLPGNRTITATYRVTAPATLTLEMTGTTDAATCMNFAQHGYWNLDGTPTWEGHALRIAADHYLPVDENLYPTGEVEEVAGTGLDFRDARKPAPTQPSLDHNFCLSDEKRPLRDVVWLTGASGLSMTVATTEPGVQIHDASAANRPGQARFEGIVIEAQGWPDAPNNRHFPSIMVTPDAPYTQTTSWRFSR